MTAYYNEHDKYAAAWLRNLIAAGEIAPGIVDERSIVDVRPEDLEGYTQVHWFAGIGVWSYALRRAGWPDNRPVWTGSAPCQPWSAAGKGRGFDDERHLWPHMYRLVKECRPDVVIGEQVASKDGLAWLDSLQTDLEDAGYASGAVDFCAASLGSPNIRQRLYWFGERLGDAQSAGRRERPVNVFGEAGADEGALAGQGYGDAARAASATGKLADAPSGGRGEERSDGRGVYAGDRTEGLPAGLVHGCNDGGMAEPDSARLLAGRRDNSAAGHGHSFAAAGDNGGVADADGGNASAERQQRSGEQRQQPQDSRDVHHDRPGPTNGFWRIADWLFCRDAKWRAVESGAFPLVNGHSGRLGPLRADWSAPAGEEGFAHRGGRLRGYGNAINAEAATAFIEAFREARNPERFIDGDAVEECVRLTPRNVFE